jgi:predicted amino acid dehydrogenase/acyl carrier protein
LDRKTLPAPDPVQSAVQGELIGPRTSTEKRVAEICTDLLRLGDIGIHDNFFELGLHSLSATQLVSRVRARMGVRVPLRHIFEAPTIAGFAAVIEQLAGDHEAQSDGADAVHRRERQNAPAIGSEICRDQLVFERRPLLSLIAAGKLAPVDAVALSYLSEDFLQRMGLSVETALSGWFDDLPCVFSIYETHLGRIAVIGLPRLRSEIYDDQSRLIEMVLEALEISQRIGGRVVSLTGLIPSATNYGRAIAQAMSGNGEHPLVSTGHATTVSTVVLTIERAMREAGRSLTRESVAFVGLGSIGYTTLRLMLQSLPHPKSLTLCDVYSRSDHLRTVRDAVIHQLNYAGSLDVVEAHRDLPPAIYDAGLIVGATNVPHVLDVERLKPGAVIVDDSGPHCFSPEQAIRRFEARKDILFTAGGVLRLPQAVRRIMYMPQRVEAQMRPGAFEGLAKFDPFNIGGCVLSGLLTAHCEGLKPTIGIVDDASCRAHYQVLQQLGLQAAGLHCLGYRLSEEGVQRFRERFGSE